jgi:hypothetical protein
MISKNPKTQEYEAKLLLKMANKLFITGMIMLTSVSFIEEWIKIVPIVVIAIILIYKSLLTNRNMLLLLDDLEKKER